MGSSAGVKGWHQFALQRSGEILANHESVATQATEPEGDEFLNHAIMSTALGADVPSLGSGEGAG